MIKPLSSLATRICVGLSFSFLATVAAGTAQAASAFLTMTQTSATTLDFAISMPGVSYSNTLTITNGSTIVGLQGSLFNFSTHDNSNIYGAIAWIDPGNPTLYNIMNIEPSGNLFKTTFTIYVDQDAAGLSFHTNTWCRLNGPFAPCPVLADGQTITVPFFGSQDDIGGGFIDVTYRDLVDAPPSPGTATPLPAGLPLFASGLAGLGWLARRGRREPQA